MDRIYFLSLKGKMDKIRSFSIRSWYDNIGAKIKSWAIWIFIFEAIATIITGIILLSYSTSEGGPGAFFAFLLLILAVPLAILIEFVSTWLLYAFGELVEKTVDNENNTREILEILNNKENKNAKKKQDKKQTTQKQHTKNERARDEQKIPENDLFNEDGFKCPNCGNFVYYGETECTNCGEEFDIE